MAPSLNRLICILYCNSSYTDNSYITVEVALEVGNTEGWTLLFPSCFFWELALIHFGYRLKVR